MTGPARQALFETARAAAWGLHMADPDVAGFSAWDGRGDYRDLPPRPAPLAHDLARDTHLPAGPWRRARDAFIALAETASWADPQENAATGGFELLGQSGPFRTPRCRGFVFYAAAGQDTGWHRAPAQELCFVVAGAARFEAEHRRPRPLGPGGIAFHASAQRRRIATGDLPVLIWMLWRGDDIRTGPVP